MSYKLIDANNIAFNSDGFITAENIVKMPCIYADLPNGMDGEHYVLEQEPKTGHWIKIFLTDTSDIDGQCSECGFIHKFIDGHTAQYNYCPECGAKMVEPQESEDKE